MSDGISLVDAHGWRQCACRLALSLNLTSIRVQYVLLQLVSALVTDQTSWLG